MTAGVVDIVLLSGVVLLCWLGALGMWRMKEPMQALHYLSLPATAGAILLTIAVGVSQGLGEAFWKVLLITAILIATNSVVTHAAVGVSQGLGEAFWKVLLITAILIATNSVVTHATARAFRARELGHWEPIDGDPMEMVHEEKKR